MSTILIGRPTTRLSSPPPPRFRAGGTTLAWLGRTLPALFVFTALGGLLAWGHHTGWTFPKFSELSGTGLETKDDWCSQHSVPDSQCVECQPNLIMNSYPGPYGQVLTNLFLNSVAHAFPDGKPGTVDIQVRESGKDNVEIIFSDNGIGMSLDVRRRAFDPFFTTRRDQGGTGLGLHIVYSIVTTRLGGRLDLDSQLGGGTRIQMILPRTAPLEQAAE